MRFTKRFTQAIIVSTSAFVLAGAGVANAAPQAGLTTSLSYFMQQDASEAAAARPVITMLPNADLSLNDERLSEEALVARLRQMYSDGYRGRIYLAASGGVTSAEVLRVINLIQDGGFTQIGIVGEDQHSESE